MDTLTGLDFYNKFGDPSNKQFVDSLIVWDVPSHLEYGFIPKKIYCHQLLINPLEQAFENLYHRGYITELKTWDGCWNFRPIRGYEKKYEAAMASNNIELAMKYLSTHSWACAVDMNAAENGLGKKPKLSAKFVKCFTDVGFEWGGNWPRPDGMHFQLARLL